jgi:hypothetical protein
MKRVLTGVVIGLLAVAPAIGWADCGEDHTAAAMASSTPATNVEHAHATSAAKAPARIATKSPVSKQVKQAADKPAPSPSKTDGSTVLAKTN